MVKRLLILTTLGVLLSGCYMAPLALLGPISSGFSTASLIQSGSTYTVNYMVKKSTGRTLGEHAIDTLTKDTLTKGILQQTYLPKSQNSTLVIAP